VRLPELRPIAIGLLAAGGVVLGFLPALVAHQPPFGPLVLPSLVALSLVAGTLGGLTTGLADSSPRRAAVPAAVGTVFATTGVFTLFTRWSSVDLATIGRAAIVAGGVTLLGLVLGVIAVAGPTWSRAVALTPLVAAAAPWHGASDLLRERIFTTIHTNGVLTGFGAAPAYEVDSPFWLEIAILIVFAALLAPGARSHRPRRQIVIGWPIAITLYWALASAFAAGHPLNSDISGLGFMTETPYLDAYVAELRSPHAEDVALLLLLIVLAFGIVLSRFRLVPSDPPSETKETVKPRTEPSRLEIGRPHPAPETVLSLAALLGLVMLWVSPVTNRLASAWTWLTLPEASDRTMILIVAVVAAVGAIGALAFAVRRNSFGSLIWHGGVALVVAIAAFVVLASDGDPTPQPEPREVNKIACYSGGDSDECPGG
jgi:hypothetical protein